MTNSLAVACAPITRGFYREKLFLPIAPNEEWFSEIVWDGVALRFGDPIGIRIIKEGRYYSIDVPELNICIGEESREQAIDSFKEEMVMIWQNYVECSLDQLQPGALQIRNEMLKRARRVLANDRVGR